MDKKTRLTNLHENGKLKLEFELYSNEDSLIEPKLGIRKTFTENGKLESVTTKLYDNTRNIRFEIKKLYDENGKVKKTEEKLFTLKDLLHPKTCVVKTTKPLARTKSFTQKEIEKIQQRSQSTDLGTSTQ